MTITTTSAGRRAFTMMEIAISLAIIGIALVAIIGILPLGMRTQRENRELTLVNQDATVLMEAVRGGAGRSDDLVNYVYAITNYWTQFTAGTPSSSGVNGYTVSSSSITWQVPAGNNPPATPLNSGTNIIGLLSTPEFTDYDGNPIFDLSAVSGNYYSNHVIALVHGISGMATEKPPQDNTLLRDSSFGYEVYCVNAPIILDTNTIKTWYGKTLASNSREVRMTFLWPVLPTGKLGNGRWTYRTTVSGRIRLDTNVNLYFYQPQSFVTNAP